jgi:hypothetical protein
LLADGRCFRHSELVTAEREREARRDGGRAATAKPMEADVPTISLKTRAERSAARERVYSLALSRVLSPPVAATLLTALKHADESQDRAEVLQLERGRRAVVPKLIIKIADWARIAPPPALPPAAPSEPDAAVPVTQAFQWRKDTP